MHQKKFNLKITLLFVVSVFCLNAFSEDWNVPTEQKALNSYVKFDAAATQDGEAIYTKNCVSCHGNPSKGNSLKSLNPVPPDLASNKTQALTDGELFYILNTGRMIMPSFKNILSETERWKVIAYIRSFNKNYTQVLSKVDPNKSKLVKVKMMYDALTGKVNVNVKANKPTGTVSLKDAEIVLFVKRYFGRLQVDKTFRTDNEGKASFIFPNDLPGDKNGNLELIVKVNDNNYGEIESNAILKKGIPTDKPALTEKRAIWNIMAKAPFWILLTYFLGVSLVLAVFLYIGCNLYKLWKLGNV